MDRLPPCSSSSRGPIIKKGPGIDSPGPKGGVRCGLEAGAEACEEVAAADAVDRAAAAEAGQAERRVAIEHIVDAHVEGIIPRDFDVHPDVVVEHSRIEHPI